MKFNFQAYKFLLSKIIIYATQQVSNIKAEQPVVHDINVLLEEIAEKQSCELK